MTGETNLYLPSVKPNAILAYHLEWGIPGVGVDANVEEQSHIDGT